MYFSIIVSSLFNPKIEEMTQFWPLVFKLGWFIQPPSVIYDVLLPLWGSLGCGGRCTFGWSTAAGWENPQWICYLCCRSLDFKVNYSDLRKKTKGSLSDFWCKHKYFYTNIYSDHVCICMYIQHLKKMFIFINKSTHIHTPPGWKL